MPTLLCHVIWMSGYCGPEEEIFAGGFDYAKENGFGHELFNFQRVDGTCYGFVQVSSGTININRLGADSEDTFIDDVTVIWTAPKEEGGRYIVGWYNSARVHRIFQQGLVRGRTVEGRRVGYMIEADSSQCTLVPPDQRDFEVPHHGKGLPGTASVFYVDGSEQMSEWLADALAYISAWEGSRAGPKQGVGKGWPSHVDPAVKALVEQHAIDETVRRLGQVSSDRQKDNCGWDLEFQKEGRTLCVEVKGLSGDELRVELTPNEYDAMRRATTGDFSDADYRLAVVTRALREDRAFYLFYHEEGFVWRCELSHQRITVQERTGARLS